LKDTWRQVVKWTRTVELGEPFTLDVPLKVEQRTITITITLPMKNP